MNHGDRFVPVIHDFLSPMAMNRIIMNTTVIST